MSKNALIIDRGRLDGVFRSGFLAQIYKLKKNSDSIVLADKFINDKKFSIYKDMGINKFISYDPKGKILKTYF